MENIFLHNNLTDEVIERLEGHIRWCDSGDL